MRFCGFVWAPARAGAARLAHGFWVRCQRSVPPTALSQTELQSPEARGAAPPSPPSGVSVSHVSADTPASCRAPTGARASRGRWSGAGPGSLAVEGSVRLTRRPRGNRGKISGFPWTRVCLLLLPGSVRPRPRQSTRGEAQTAGGVPSLLRGGGSRPVCAGPRGASCWSEAARRPAPAFLRSRTRRWRRKPGSGIPEPKTVTSAPRPAPFSFTFPFLLFFYFPAEAALGRPHRSRGPCPFTVPRVLVSTPAAPGPPGRSPIQARTRPHPAWLPRPDGVGHVEGGGRRPPPPF